MALEVGFEGAGFLLAVEGDGSLDTAGRQRGNCLDERTVPVVPRALLLE